MGWKSGLGRIRHAPWAGSGWTIPQPIRSRRCLLPRCGRSVQANVPERLGESHHQRWSVFLVPHQGNWASFLEVAGYGCRDVLVALDTAGGRRSVQASLPGWIANAWTQPGDLGVSSHSRFDAPGACLACLYLPLRPQANEDELV